MEVEVPRGRQTVEAWRALSPQARQDALAAARRGVAPSDVGVAWAAAGYGRTAARRIRILRMLSPVALAVVAIPAALALAFSRASKETVDVVITLLFVATLGGIFGLGFWARRYQRLQASGLLGMEAARLGSLAPNPGRSVWGGAAAESGFTVPFHAQVPIPQPLARPAADPAGAGVREVPLRRGRFLVSLAVLVVLALVFWLLVAVIWHGSDPPAVLATAITIVAVFFTLLIAFILYASGPTLRRPVTARFTPDGWELPPQRTSGSWADVRAIRVRPLSAGGMATGSPQLAGVRVVALIVEDPQRYVMRRGPMRRAVARANLRKYGSPVIIVAMPRRTVPVVELVQLLQHYTSAPVEWSVGNETIAVS